MKVIRPKKTNQNEPKIAICEECEAELEYTQEDVFTKDFGCAYITCPECNIDIILDNSEYAKDITIDNISFPQDFSNPQKAVTVSDEEINEWIQNCLKELKESNNNDYIHTGSYTYTGSGDTYVYVFKFEDEYVVHVGKKNYECAIER